MMMNMETGLFGNASKANQTTEGKRCASSLKAFPIYINSMKKMDFECTFLFFFFNLKIW